MSTPLGTAVMLQIKKASQIAQKTTVCDNCSTSASDLPTKLKVCTGCRCVGYCSKDCQKKDWSRHKPFCHLVQRKGAPDSFLTHVGVKSGKERVVEMVIDSYRLRVEHDHLYRQQEHGLYYQGKQLPDGNVFASGDVYDDFQNYLDCAELAGILPKWWDFHQRMECLAQAVDREGHAQNVFTHVEEDKLADRNDGDRQIRSTLIFLAELVVGYEGWGPPKNADWISRFKSHADTLEVKELIEQDNVASLQSMYAKYERDWPRADNM